MSSETMRQLIESINTAGSARLTEAAADNEGEIFQASAELYSWIASNAGPKKELLNPDNPRARKQISGWGMTGDMSMYEKFLSLESLAHWGKSRIPQTHAHIVQDRAKVNWDEIHLWFVPFISANGYQLKHKGLFIGHPQAEPDSEIRMFDGDTREQTLYFIDGKPVQRPNFWQEIQAITGDKNMWDH